MLHDRLVARHRVVLGVLKRHSLLGLRHWVSRDRVWQSARLFSPGELARQAARRRVKAVR